MQVADAFKEPESSECPQYSSDAIAYWVKKNGLSSSGNVKNKIRCTAPARPVDGGNHHIHIPKRRMAAHAALQGFKVFKYGWVRIKKESHRILNAPGWV